MKGREYSDAKIRENLEAEALGVCTAEAYDKYGDKVQEIDVSDLAIDEVVDLVEKIINDEVTCPVGEINFMDWLISHP